MHITSSIGDGHELLGTIGMKALDFLCAGEFAHRFVCLILRLVGSRVAGYPTSVKVQNDQGVLGSIVTNGVWALRYEMIRSNLISELLRWI